MSDWLITIWFIGFVVMMIMWGTRAFETVHPIEIVATSVFWPIFAPLKAWKAGK